ncbi:hypothetical protein FACS1894188_12400 [Clostridia bacterium]|nr:hypothetical protein FACS1894188_12400 [Clostridia bacterium]
MKFIHYFELDHREDGTGIAGTDTVLPYIKPLQACLRCAVFAATLGHGADTEIRSAFARSPSSGLALDTAANRNLFELHRKIEEEVLAASGAYIMSVISPGSCYLDISYQKDIVSILNTIHTTGIFVNDYCVLTPSKTVTGIIGISETPVLKENQCDTCTHKCEYGRSTKNGITVSNSW